MTKRKSLFDWWETHWVKIVSAFAATVTVITVSALYINIPIRMAKAEEQIDDLKGWAKELQGYTRAMNQQTISQASPRVWQVTDKDGQVYCTDGKEDWWPDREGKCK